MTPDGGVPAAWRHLAFWRTAWPGVAAALAGDRRRILPPAGQRFAALDLCPPEAVRVVILGQDPYPGAGHATGLAFSVPPGTRPLPPSLANILRELRDDLAVTRATGDLTGWARQGVLLLNTVLTVPEGEPGGHARLGWQALTAEVLREVAARRPVAFLLWGRHAQAAGRAAAGAGHLVLAAPHPSPLSARRGFLGSRPFGAVNRWLAGRGEAPIDWAA